MDTSQPSDETENNMYEEDADEAHLGSVQNYLDIFRDADTCCLGGSIQECEEEMGAGILQYKRLCGKGQSSRDERF
jgi:hypothetical protein